MSVVRCVTRLSNPAPQISWRLGSELLSTDLHTQTEAPEPREPGKLMATSELRYTFNREHEGKQVWSWSPSCWINKVSSMTETLFQIICEVSHEAYESGRSETVRADLDILCK